MSSPSSWAKMLLLAAVIMTAALIDSCQGGLGMPWKIGDLTGRWIHDF